jgi:hypothetical protein
MRIKWEVWAFERLQDRERCLMEPGMSCIPLRGDTICHRCYEVMMEEEEREQMNITCVKDGANE